MFKEDWLLMAKDKEKWNTTIDTHFKNLSNQNEAITCFEYELFDRYDLQEEEEAENYVTIPERAKIMSMLTMHIWCKKKSITTLSQNANLVSNY